MSSPVHTRTILKRLRLLGIVFAAAAAGTFDPEEVTALSRRFDQLLQDTLQVPAAHCSVPEYVTVGEGIRATSSHATMAAPPFVVRNALAKTETQEEGEFESLRRDYGMAGLMERYGATRNHFAGTAGLNEDVQTALARLKQNCGSDIAAKKPCLSHIHHDDIDGYDKLAGSLVGIHLDEDEQSRFDYVFNATNEGDASVVSSRHRSQLGVILSSLGAGVIDDWHYTVHFLHVVGRKLWLFHRHKYGQLEGVGRQPGGHKFSKSRSPCDANYTSIVERAKQDLDLMACVLQPGDYLYAPAGVYHSTCHLDEVTATLIQFDKSEPDDMSEYHFEETMPQEL